MKAEVEPATESVAKYNWERLNHLQLGRYAEYY
jgi:hypothetical protein